MSRSISISSPVSSREMCIRDSDGIDAVDPDRVAGDAGVEPAYPAGPPGRGAVLVTSFPEILAQRAFQLGWEGPVADPGRVGLEDPDGPPHMAGTDAGPRQRAARRRIGAGHVGICLLYTSRCV